MVPTQNSHNLVVLQYFQRSRGNKTQGFQTLPLVEEHVSGRPVAQGEVDCQSPEAAVTGQSKGGLFVEDLSVQMDTNVSTHVSRTVAQYLRMSWSW